MVESDPLNGFSGQARLFPLPDHVLFPAVVQPLHLFESRYLELVENALLTDRFIAMGMLSPGWQSEYYSRPPVESTVCLGHIMSHERLDGGKYNILLRGAARARIVRELPPLRSFREVELELLQDDMSGCTPSAMDAMCRRLLTAAKRFFHNQTEVTLALQEIVKLNVNLGHLCDLLSHLMPIDASTKQLLLAEVRVIDRVERLLADLERISVPSNRPSEWKFPPDFSVN